MDLAIHGLRVLVTAGASGIGLATARAFEREGARVHVCDVDRGALKAIASTDPAIAQSVCDVGDGAGRKACQRDGASLALARDRQGAPSSADSASPRAHQWRLDEPDGHGRDKSSRAHVPVRAGRA